MQRDLSIKFLTLPFSPRLNGATCKGDPLNVVVCKLGSCNPSKDPRQEACEEHFGKELPAYALSSIIPAAPARDDKSCTLMCHRLIRNNPPKLLETHKVVSDGTPCSYDDPHSYCLLGNCHNVGCDYQINSGKRFNDCGVCGGNHDNCLYEVQQKKKTNKSVGREFRDSY